MDVNTGNRGSFKQEHLKCNLFFLRNVWHSTGNLTGAIIFRQVNATTQASAIAKYSCHPRLLNLIVKRTLLLGGGCVYVRSIFQLYVELFFGTYTFLQFFWIFPLK